MSESWKIDPSTLDYVMENGKPVIDIGLSTPAVIRLRGHRTKWLYAPDSKWGSDFYAIRQRNNQQTPKLLETTAQRALQPMLDDGRASSVTVVTTQTTRYSNLLNTQIIDAEGNETNLTVKPIGR